MITGMTGFGSADISSPEIKGSVEIKSVNHRYFDLAYYLPPGFGSIEEKIKNIVNAQIDRGRVTVSVKISQRTSHAFYLNEGIVKQYIEYGKYLKKNYHLKDELTVSDVIRLPGVIDVRETAANAETLWPFIEKSLHRALKGLMHMRRREGRSLHRDIYDKLRKMQVQISNIKTRSKAILTDKKKILSGEEFSSFQKSEDINEELSRLAHYIEETKVLLRTGSLVGKRLDFVAQEMQRETNTIGSKVQDKEVSNAVIALKSKIEKIREQSQNVE